MCTKIAVTTPYDQQLSRMSTSMLVDLWQSAHHRTVLAEHGLAGSRDVADYWTQLAVATRVAQQITAGRWCVVAQLLRHHAVRDWAQVGNAIDLTETEARDGFYR